MMNGFFAVRLGIDNTEDPDFLSFCPFGDGRAMLLCILIERVTVATAKIANPCGLDCNKAKPTMVAVRVFH